MPEISRFLGIIIYMHFNEHNPPHFHVRYNEHRAAIEIETLALQDGYLPPRVLGIVIEWAEMHQSALRQNWISLQEIGSFSKVPPLV